MELALGRSSSITYPGIVRLQVSILVFVELALGPDVIAGMRSDMLDVSILVFVELALGLLMSAKAHVEDHEFQSLFLWNSPSDCRCDVRPMQIQSVSILVFVELALGQCWRSWHRSQAI